MNQEGISISAAAAVLGITEKVAVVLVFRELGLEQGRDPATVVLRPHTVRRLRGYLVAHPRLVTEKRRSIRAKEIRSDAEPPKFLYADGSPEAIAWRNRNIERRKTLSKANMVVELAKALGPQSKKLTGRGARSKTKGASTKKSKLSDSAPSPESSVERKCSLCGRVVTVGLVTKNVLPHADASRPTCAGSGMALANTLESASKKPKPIPKGKSKATGGAKPSTPKGGAAAAKAAKRKRVGTDRASLAIRRSEQEERALRRARYDEEFGGRDSFRTYSAGSPGLGKRR